MSKLRVAVLFGGMSSEHSVSLASATSIIRNLDDSLYDVLPIGITPQGGWLLEGNPLCLLKNSGQPHKETPLSSGDAINWLARNQVDIVFPVLHGPNGEDGVLQGLLETACLPYVGSGVLASAVAMDKAAMKSILSSRGLPITEHKLVLRSHWQTDPRLVHSMIEAEMSFPLFVKPANLGSSIGISKIDSSSCLPAAIDLACTYDRRIIVESGVIDAREIECAVIGNDTPQASVPGEVFPPAGFYDYRSKYEGAGAKTQIPAELPQATAQRIQSLAIEAFKALDCAGLARVDFLISAQTDSLYILEANTMPGFTSTSMFPELWSASGMHLPKLLTTLIQFGLERHLEKPSFRNNS